ncbi:DivIVA domain-containing protein [Heliophilum fasciatum]|uniref:DivIVA protein n=1 Tax=Heliophilum fasciatum TaxID=35700 RepID=A0A4R2RKH8_9FIRM|nr:DivIVA domain-containing protein [Heliophilum fasciatum]MCW2277990.1 cell division septum initiation protein DivIVA [Heliophilum fasciatum]TCP64390.1 DivIVA protein [Heliophilum fasciatum]
MKPEELDAILDVKRLKRTFHGYEPGQVQEVLTLVAQLYRELYHQRALLQRELGTYQWKEEYIKAALIRAELTAADIEKAAKEKARLIKATAEAEVAALRKDAREQLRFVEKTLHQIFNDGQVSPEKLRQMND